MTSIARRALENAPDATERWAHVAALISAWADESGVHLRDAVVLLPYAQLLPPARAAFARTGRWMPRTDTTKTLAAALGPASEASAGQITFDAAVDVLSAATLLRDRPWAAAWARRDARAFEQGARALTATAHAMARAAFALPPSLRAAHWEAARQALTPVTGPGATERLLARVALEWASLSPPPATDRLFEIKPAAWIAVQAGGTDAMVMRLMADTGVPCLVIETDPPADDPFALPPAHVAPAYAVCADFENEAQCAAAQVLAHIERAEVPVALIAQDRVLVRRVRALLERAQVTLLDETGWTLSTTRAAAQVMSLLNAARAEATTDALLDWLKAGTAWAHADGGAALAELETACRTLQLGRRAALGTASLPPAAQRLNAAASAVLVEFAAAARQPLGGWLTALARALSQCGAIQSLQADDAGRQLLMTLRLAGDDRLGSAWSLGAAEVVMNLDAFRDWVDNVLEQATFKPAAPAAETTEVIVTPLARTMLRPFAAVVFAGADETRLGASPAADTLLGDAQAAELGIPTTAERRQSELLAFVQLLAIPRVTLMRRRAEGTEPLADSPLVERLALALAARGQALATWHDPRIESPVKPAPIRMSAPAAAGLLPQRLSASACDALRACPYRFFALNMLRLREDNELDREIEKRDYGTWLHAVLFDFHARRESPAAADAEVAQLLALAEAQRSTLGMADADFLPFAASFGAFAPRYVAWLHARDNDGAQWRRGEDRLAAQPEAFGGIEMIGVIDRIDEVRLKSGPAFELIDYKTGSAASLKEKLKDRTEDTQLAFYAALMGAHSDLPLQAMYLAVDGSKGLEQVPHPDVAESAALLVAGLGSELQAIRAGQGLPALGEGITCEHCDARGICRRDHWSAEAEAAAPRPAGAGT